MQFWFRMILLSAALFAIGWFISFQYNPYNVCKDHPDPHMRDFFQCEPGGFSLQKGSRLERSDDDRFPWEKNGDVIIGTEDPKRRYLLEKQRQEYVAKQRQAELDQWDCSDKFAQLSEEEFLKLSVDDLSKFCVRKTKSRRPLPSLEDVPNSGTEDL